MNRRDKGEPRRRKDEDMTRCEVCCGTGYVDRSDTSTASLATRELRRLIDKQMRKNRAKKMNKG